jgi:hypothetical protein
VRLSSAERRGLRRRRDAVRAAETGEKVIALDLDPQGSLAAWAIAPPMIRLLIG